MTDPKKEENGNLSMPGAQPPDESRGEVSKFMDNEET